MQGPVRPFTQEPEPKVPKTTYAPPSVPGPEPQERMFADLDALTQAHPEADPLQVAAGLAAQGVSGFKWKGQEYESAEDLAGAFARTRPRAEAEPPGPRMSVEPGSLPRWDDEKEKEASDALRRSAAGAFMEQVGDSEMPGQSKGYFRAYVENSLGLGTDWNYLDIENGLNDREKRYLKSKVEHYNRWMSERASKHPSVPDIGGAWGRRSSSDRLRILLQHGTNPENADIWDWVAGSLGEEAKGLLSQAQRAQKEAYDLNILLQPDDAIGRDELEKMYWRSKQVTVASPQYAFMLRHAAEKAAKDLGVPYEEVREMPADEVVEYVKFGGDMVPVKKNRGGVAGLMKDTQKLLKEVLKVKVGEDASEYIIASEKYEMAAMKAAVKILEKAAPEEWDGLGKSRGNLSFGDLLAVAQAFENGETLHNEEAAGRAHIGHWFLNALMFTTRQTGKAMLRTGMFGAPKPHMFVFEDGSVFDDPIEAGLYAEHLRANTPNAEWRESPSLNPGLFAGGDGTPIKPSIISIDKMTLGSEYRQKAIEEADIFKVVFERLSAYNAPDDKVRRVAAGSLALGADIAGDLTTYATLGGTTLLKQSARAEKYLEQMRKMGIFAADKMGEVGLRTVDEMLTKLAKGRDTVGNRAMRNRTVVRLSDGTRLSSNRAAQYQILREMMGEEAADAIVHAAIRDPMFHTKGLAAFASDDNTLRALKRSFDAHGLKTNSIEEVHDLFLKTMPQVQGVLKLGQSARLGRFYQSMYRPFMRGQQAANTLGRGLYIGSMPVSPLVTDAFSKFLKVGGQKLKVAGDYLGVSDPIAAGIAKVKDKTGIDFVQARLALRSTWDVNVVRMLDAATGTRQGFRLLSPEESRAVNAARRARAASETQIRKLQASWMLTEGGRQAPTKLYRDVLHMWESGGKTFDEAVAYAAYARKVDMDVRRGRFWTKHHDGGITYMKAEEAMDVLEEIRKGVTADDIAKVRKEWEGYESLYENGMGVLNKMGETYSSMGIARQLDEYAPHIWQIPEDWAGTELWKLENRQIVMKDKALQKHRARLSPHRRERVGPPTLVEGMIVGLNPVNDARLVMEARLQGYMDDIAETELLTSLAKSVGTVGPDGYAAAMTVLGRSFPVLGQAGPMARKAIREAAANSNKFRLRLEEMRGMLTDFRDAGKKLDSYHRKVLRKEEHIGRLQKRVADTERYTRRQREQAAADLVDAEQALVALREEREAADQVYNVIAAERDARLGAIAEEFDFTMKELRSWADHTTFGRKLLGRELGRISQDLKRLTGKTWRELREKPNEARVLPHNYKGRQSEVDDLVARANALDEQRLLYRETAKELNARGMNPGMQGAVLWHLYKKPTLYHLTPDELSHFVDGHVSVVRAFDETHFDKMGPAYDAWKKAGKKDRTIYSRWIQPDQAEFVKGLQETYLPVETVFALRSLGYKVGTKAALEEAAVAGALARFGENFSRMMLPVNRWFKSAVTVFNPSLHFGRRNQIDLWSRMFQYSGLHAFRGPLREEFNAWRAGNLSSVMDGFGNVLDARQMWEEASPLFQTLERRLDAEAPIRAARTAEVHATELMGAKRKWYAPWKKTVPSQQELAEGIGEQTIRSAKAADPKRRGLQLDRASTQGRPPTATEKVLPYGTGASEAFDNELRAWVYFVNRKSGKNHADALDEAFRVGRDYSNLTAFESRTLVAAPILFYNFFKQNLRSIPHLMQGGGIGRIANMEKFREHIQAEVPEDMIPHWMGVMDRIGGRDRIGYLPRDLGGVAVLDPVATLLNGMGRQMGWYRGLTGQSDVPMALAFEEAAKQTLDMSAPVVQMWWKADELGTLRVSPRVAKALGDALIPEGENEFSAFGVKVFRSGNTTKVEVSGGMRALLGFSGLSVWATTTMKHADTLAQQSKGIFDWLNVAGVIKPYDYNYSGEENVRQFRESLLRYGDQLSMLSRTDLNTLEQVVNVDNIGEDGYRFIVALWEVVGGGDGTAINKDGFLRDIIADLYKMKELNGVKGLGPGPPKDLMDR